MRILICSNSQWTKTGYGVQTALTIPRLQAQGHEVGVLGYHGLAGGILNMNGVPVYPPGFHPYGQDILVGHYHNFKADIAVTLMDSWVCEPNLFADARWVAWTPIDHQGMPPGVYEKSKQAWARIAMSKHGQNAMMNRGLDSYYVPLSVDTNIYKPMDRAEARMALGWPKDDFIIGIVAMNKGNPSRKAFTQQLEAFNILHDRHPDTKMYLHCIEGPQMGGVDLRPLINHLDIGDSVSFADQYMMIVGYPDEYMVKIYNAMDVLSSATMGEGFGVPLIEAQACGVPVITGEWTSGAELCFSGWTIPFKFAEPFWTPQNENQYLPHISAIVQAYEEAYQNARDIPRETARNGALGYDADHVAVTYWTPTLVDIGERIALQNEQTRRSRQLLGIEAAK